MSMYIHNSVKLYQLVLKILSGYEIILTSIKSNLSVTNSRKMTGNDPKLDLVNINAHTKFGLILSICSCLLSGTKILKEILPYVKGHNSVTNVRK